MAAAEIKQPEPAHAAEAPEAAEKPTTYNKRAQLVAIALVVIIMAGLVVQTVVNMRARGDRKAQQEAEAEERALIAAQTPRAAPRSFRDEQEAAARELAAERAKANAGAKAQEALDSIREDSKPKVAQDRQGLTPAQAAAEWEVDETRRVLMAGRDGFGKLKAQRTEAVSQSSPLAGNGAAAMPLPPAPVAPTTALRQPGRGGNAAEIERLNQVIADGEARALAARTTAAQVQEALRTGGPSAAVAVTNPAAVAAAGGGRGVLPSSRTQSLLGSQPSSDTVDPRFGESAQNRAFRDPVNAGPRDGEMLVPTGTVASAALKFDAISDYNGDWIAELQRPVYDITGEWILFPTGTKIVGKTVRATTVNEPIQNRMGFPVQWAIRPDGKRIDLRKSSGLDAAGVAALKDQVDYHVLAQMFGVLAYAVVGLGPATATSGEAQSNRDVALTEATGQARQLGRNIAAKYLQIVPTVTIRAGTPIKIFLEDDLYVAPWAPVDARFYSTRD